MIRPLVPAAVAILLLSGCATLPEPSGPTAAEQAEFLQYRSDRYWQSTGLPDSARPTVEVIRRVSKGEVEEVRAACLETAAAPHDQAATAIAVYECQVAYPVDPLMEGLVSDEQHEYAWRYFTDWLMPCLSLAGYPVHHVPSHGEFSTRHTDEYHWNPYIGIATPDDDRAASELRVRCPASPFADATQSTG